MDTIVLHMIFKVVLGEKEEEWSRKNNLYQGGHPPHFQTQWYEKGLWRKQYPQGKFKFLLEQEVKGTFRKSLKI